MNFHKQEFYIEWYNNSPFIKCKVDMRQGQWQNIHDKWRLLSVCVCDNTIWSIWTNDREWEKRMVELHMGGGSRLLNSELGLKSAKG